MGCHDLLKCVRKQSMRIFVLIAALLCSGVFLGCQERELDPAVLAAYQHFVQALKADDREALYAQSPVALHARMDVLYLRWKTVVARVREEYPEAEKIKTLELLAATIIDRTSSGKDLFMALLEDLLEPPGPPELQGLEVADLIVRNKRAIVTTKAGEVFEFVTDQNQWRCTLLDNQFTGDTYTSLKMLEANMDTVASNLDSWRVASRDTTDQTRPEGALNTIVQAFIYGKRMTVYEVLSEATTQLLAEGARLSGTLRKQLKATNPKPDSYREFLVQRSLEWVARVVDGRSLFAILWDTGRFKSIFPLTRSSKIQSVLPGQGGGAVVLVRTNSEQSRYTMRVNKDGKWKLQDLESAVREVAVQPIQRALEALKQASAPAETVP
jgi:hypothetical protein